MDITFGLKIHMRTVDIYPLGICKLKMKGHWAAAHKFVSKTLSKTLEKSGKVRGNKKEFISLKVYHRDTNDSHQQMRDHSILCSTA